METPSKGGQKPMPMLTPKTSDGSQRIIKQIMVIDPNKLKSAGLDVRMAEALKKSKARRTPTSSPVVQTKEDKLALAKSKLNKKLKQTQMLKELPAKGVATTLRPNAKFVENAVRNLTYSNLTKVAEPRPQIKVADLMSLMPPPSSPPVNKSQTVVINFLKRDQTTEALDVNFVPPESQNKIDAIPKASIRKSSVNKNKTTPNNIESKVISSEVKFELKKKSKPAEINVSFSEKTASSNATVNLELVPTVKQSPVEEQKSPPKLQKNLPQVIESKILSPEEKIDLRTLRAKSSTKLTPQSVTLAATAPLISPEKSATTISQAEKDKQATNSEQFKEKSEESAVDFIKLMFEEKSKNESHSKVVSKEEPVEDATSFLMSLFGQQATLIPPKDSVSTTPKRTVKPFGAKDHTAVPKQSLLPAFDRLVQPEEPKKGGVIELKENRVSAATAPSQNISNKDERPFCGSVITFTRSQKAERNKSKKVMPPESTLSVHSSKEHPSPNPEEQQAIDTSVDAVCTPSITDSTRITNEDTHEIVADKNAGRDVSFTDLLSKGEKRDSDPCSMEKGSKLKEELRGKEQKDLPQQIDPNAIKKNEATADQSVASDLILTDQGLKDEKILDLNSTEQKPEVESESQKEEQKDPHNDATPPLDKTNEALKTTATARRKSTKSVPVLIAKLKKSRKPPDSQVKQTKKDEQAQSDVSKESQTQPQKIASVVNIQPPEGTEKSTLASIDRNQQTPAVDDAATDLDAQCNKTAGPSMRRPGSLDVISNKNEEPMLRQTQENVPTNSPTIEGPNVNRSEPPQNEMKKQTEPHQTEINPQSTKSLECESKLTIEGEAKIQDRNASKLATPTAGERSTPKKSEPSNDSLLDNFHEEKTDSHLATTPTNARTPVRSKRMGRPPIIPKSPVKVGNTSILSSSPTKSKEKNVKVVTKAANATVTSERSSQDVLIEYQIEKSNVEPAKQDVKECEEENLETSATTKRKSRSSEVKITARKSENASDNLNATHPTLGTKSRNISESQSLELTQGSSKSPDNVGTTTNISEKPLGNVILPVTDLQDNQTKEVQPVDRRRGRRSIAEKSTKKSTASEEESLLITKDDKVNALSPGKNEDTAPKGTPRSTSKKKTDDVDLKQVTTVKTSFNTDSSPSKASISTAKTSVKSEVDENVKVDATKSEESVSIPSTSQQSINKIKKESKMLDTKVMSPPAVSVTNKNSGCKNSGSEATVESDDSSQIVSDMESASSTISEGRTPRRSRKKTVKFLSENEPLIDKETKQKNNAKIDVPSKLDLSQKIDTVSASENISSPISDGWDNCDSDFLIAVKTDEKKNKPSSVTPDEKSPSPKKAKNPFKKVKQDGNADFLGFNDKEIEEGQQSTSLRLSQSEDVLPTHPLSPPEVSNKAKGSRSVSKTPLSGGKKLKAQPKNWTKNAAASLKNWLKAPDKSSGSGDAEKIPSDEINSSIPPKKRRGKEQNSNETIKLDQKLITTQPKDPDTPAINETSATKGKTKKRTKDDKNDEKEVKKDEEKSVKTTKDSALEVNRIPQIANTTEEAPENSGKRKRKSKKEPTKPVKAKAKSPLKQNTSVISNEKATNPSNDSEKKKSKKTAIKKMSAHDNLMDESVTHNTESVGELKTQSTSTGKKGKKPDVEKPIPEVDEVASKTPCQSTDILPTAPQTPKRRGRPAKSETKTVNSNTESTGEFKTPCTPGGRKRKATTPVVESTPEVDEPPCKIPCELSDADLLITPPPPRRIGRPRKNENITPKSSYKPLTPVSPLERKYKNDTEFNPRLLLIRSKEELKSDEPITDPDLQAVPKSKTDIQCALCMGYSAKNKWLQHISSHYGVGWIMGTEPPVNVKSRASVLNYMVEFFKLTKVKGLNCRLCQGQRRSALGLLVHLEQCAMTEDELKDSRVKCEHCNNDYSRISIVIHLRSCPALMKSRFEERKEEAKASICLTEEDVLSNAGRLKRKSVIKAETKFKNMDDFEFIPDELIKHIPQQRSDNQPAIWQREILAFGKAFCLQRKCEFTATTVEELEHHCQENVCSFFINPGYICMKCKFHSKSMDTVRNHVLEKHQPRPAKDFEDSSDDAELGSESCSDSGSSCDDEDENEAGNEGHQKPKRRRNVQNRKRNPQKNAPTKDFKKLLPDRRHNIALLVAKWIEKFVKRNYSKDPLFSFATPSAIQMEVDGCETYFPKSPISMKFITNGFNGFVKEFGKSTYPSQQWQNLERLQGTGMEHEHTMYVGGPIKSIAWVPMDPYSPSSAQYLAIATRKGIDKFTRFVQQKRSRSLIFIQKYNISELPELSGEIHYALAIDKGPIHSIEFLPSGGYSTELNRLGMLAVATVETEIEIYSLPLEVEKRRCDTFPIIRLKPSFTLCLELPDSSNEYSEEYESQCTSLVWSQTAGHNYILGGYLNGYVAIWDISDEEDNLNRFVIDGVKKFVPVTYFWTMDNRIRQIAAHYDMDGLRWLAVCNSTRKLLLYDLREISKPFLFCVDTTKNVCNSMDWPIVWENLSYGLGDAMPSHGNCINTVSPMSLVYIHRRFDKFCCGINDIHFNPWRNVYAAGADNGDIHITTMREAFLDVGLRMKNDQKVISTLDIVPLDVNESSEKTAQTPADGWRLFETDYKEKYGLIFGSSQKIIASRKRDFYGTKRIPPLNMRRLMRVNRVRFNPNRNANALLAVGYDNGFIRVLQTDWYKQDLKDSNDDV